MIFFAHRYFHVVMLIRARSLLTKAQGKLLLLTFFGFNCSKILLHIFTGETLLFKWRVVLRSQMMYFWRCFPLNFAFFMAPHE